MLNYLRSMFLVISALLLMCGAFPALSADDSFADYKYVLHIDDMDPSKQELVLNNVEQSAAGLSSRRGRSRNRGLWTRPAPFVCRQRQRQSASNPLAMSGVKFSACGNTLKGMTKQLG